MGFLGLFSGKGDGPDRADEVALRRLEEKLDTALRTLGLSSGSASSLASFSPAVADLITRGNKLEAIKRYREETGVGLAEAKAAIDSGVPQGTHLARIEQKLDRVLQALQHGDRGETPSPRPFADTAGSYSAYEMSNATEPAWMGEVKSEIRAGRLINAIKVHRENTGLGLRESKDAVDEMAAELRRNGHLR